MSPVQYRGAGLILEAFDFLLTLAEEEIGAAGDVVHPEGHAVDDVQQFRLELLCFCDAPEGEFRAAADGAGDLKRGGPRAARILDEAALVRQFVLQAFDRFVHMLDQGGSGRLSYPCAARGQRGGDLIDVLLHQHDVMACCLVKFECERHTQHGIDFIKRAQGGNDRMGLRNAAVQEVRITAVAAAGHVFWGARRFFLRMMFHGL